jgi:hypothetical protein
MLLFFILFSSCVAKLSNILPYVLRFEAERTFNAISAASSFAL